MASDDIKHAFPEGANQHGHEINRQKVERAVHKIRDQAGRIAAHQGHNGAPPAIRAGKSHRFNDQISLVAGIPHSHQGTGYQERSERWS